MTFPAYEGRWGCPSDLTVAQAHLQDEPAQIARPWLCTTVQTACSGALWLAGEALTSEFPSGCARASRSGQIPAGTRQPLHKCRAPAAELWRLECQYDLAW